LWQALSDELILRLGDGLFEPLHNISLGVEMGLSLHLLRQASAASILKSSAQALDKRTAPKRLPPTTDALLSASRPTTDALLSASRPTTDALLSANRFPMTPTSLVTAAPAIPGGGVRPGRSAPNLLALGPPGLARIVSQELAATTPLDSALGGDDDDDEMDDAVAAARKSVPQHGATRPSEYMHPPTHPPRG
jgi:hypothetical protein